MLQIYVTDCLKLINENIVNVSGGGKTLARRFAEIINPQKEETRTPDEIINHIKAKLGGGGES